MIRATDWRPVQKNTLQGFCSLQLEPSGITLHDCSLHRMPAELTKAARTAEQAGPVGRPKTRGEAP